jgi:hypothetical protein
MATKNGEKVRTGEYARMLFDPSTRSGCMWHRRLIGSPGWASSRAASGADTALAAAPEGASGAGDASEAPSARGSGYCCGAGAGAGAGAPPSCCAAAPPPLWPL